MVVAREIGIATSGWMGGCLFVWKMCYFLACSAKQNVGLDPIIRPAHTPPSPLMKKDSRISSS